MMKPGLRTMWMAFFLCAVMMMNIAAADIGNGPCVADRKEFEALFAAEEYDKAAEFYRERDLQQIQSLDDYKAFLDIQSALADESADYALVISKLKVLQQRGFAPTGWQSSVAAWVSYATGRQAESVGDYDAAVTAYEQAGGTADSVSRLEVCLQLKRQTSEAAAKRLLQEGKQEQNAEKVQQAKELYAALGKTDKVALCNQTLEDIADAQQYAEAVQRYQDALAKNDRALMMQAKKAFADLGKVQDSESYLVACRKWLADDARNITVTLQLDGTALTVAWSDSAESTENAAYQVTIQQKDAPQVSQQVQAGDKTEISIKNLIPEVAYAVSVKEVHSGKQSQTQEVQVPAAAAFSRWGMTCSDMKIETASRSMLVAFDYWQLREKFMTDSSDAFVMARGSISQQENSYFVILPFSVTETAEIDLPCQWVIRTAANGTYASEAGQEQGNVQPGMRPFFVSCDSVHGENVLDKLLDALYQANDRTWPETRVCVEYYLDGELAGQTYFELTNGK